MQIEASVVVWKKSLVPPFFMKRVGITQEDGIYRLPSIQIVEDLDGELCDFVSDILKSGNITSIVSAKFLHIYTDEKLHIVYHVQITDSHTTLKMGDIPIEFISNQMDQTEMGKIDPSHRRGFTATGGL